jgi:hypothetical protein
VTAGGTAARYYLSWINPESISVLLQPAERALSIGNADSLRGFPVGQLIILLSALHPVISPRGDESSAGEILVVGAELPEVPTSPCTAIEKDHAGRLVPGQVMIGWKENLHIHRLPISLLVGELLSGVGGQGVIPSLHWQSCFFIIDKI